jgi:aspartate aminotransferase
MNDKKLFQKRISQRVKAITPSATIAIANRAKEMKRNWLDVIELGGGVPDFDTPAHIVTATEEALRLGHTHYGLARGARELRQAISEKLKRDNDITADPEKEIIVTPGAKQAILYTLLSLLEPGDEVLIPEPSWVSYPSVVLLAGGRPVGVPTIAENRFKPSVNKLSRKLTSRTRVMIINNPCNPTGTVLEPSLMAEIAAFCYKHDLILISDEVYEKIIYSGSFLSFPAITGMQDQVVTINGFSKHYAMTGWRLGYMAGPSWLIDQVVKVQQQSATCVCDFAQYGALAALNGPQDCLQKMRDAYLHRRDSMMKVLNSISCLKCLLPEGAFYFLVDITRTGLSSHELASRLLEQARVTTVPGNEFGRSREGFLRMNFAVKEPQIEEGLNRINRFFSVLA